MLKRYKVTIKYSGDRKYEINNVNKVETDYSMHGEPIIITFDDVFPQQYPLENGTTIEITEADVKTT